MIYARRMPQDRSGQDAGAPLTPAERRRRRANRANLSTPLGLLVARLGGARRRPGPYGLVLAEGYRFRFPVAGAFTVGDVIITARSFDALLRRTPDLLRHEELHARQYARCLGLPYLGLYVLAMGWSVVRTGDRASGNVFERRAGLVAGGYVERPVRSLRRRRRRHGAGRGRAG
ncbi:hypothetical protein SAMN04488544_0087 [Microlunatus sagamiharensis]|uniref:DUF4157 domain-containing protein n=2 Tax=Microlunatus sagamiharensis TaxID=546874 RepID=A0A1H2LGL2_9ACTN|nr:hypothetical protein SAMN04488544_0087 [Microlunatus sagamiharensis]